MGRFGSNIAAFLTVCIFSTSLAKKATTTPSVTTAAFTTSSTTATTTPSVTTAVSTTSSTTATTTPSVTTAVSTTSSTTATTTPSVTTPASTTSSTTATTTLTKTTSEVNIPCYSGFEKNSSGSCVDVDECAKYEDCVGNVRFQECKNFPGGYSCVCMKGYVHTNNFGIVSCRHITTMTQRFGIEYKSQYGNTSSSEFRILSNDLAQNISKCFGNYNAVIFIRRFTNESSPPGLTAWYEALAYGGTPLKPTYLQESQRTCIENGYWERQLPNTTVEISKPAPQICLSSMIRSNLFYLPSPAKFWTFGDANAGTWAKSKETCGNSRLGYTASIECQVNSVGSAYYETATLRESACTESISDILNQIKTETATAETIESTMALVDAFSSAFPTFLNTMEIQGAVATIDLLSDAITSNNIEITESTMNYLLWTTENIHLALEDELQSNENESLTAHEKTIFVKSLEIFANNMIVKQPTGLRLVTSSSIFQAKRVEAGSNKTLTFSAEVANSALPHAYSHPSVTAKIPSSALPNHDAFKQTPTNALFYYHTDGVLFPKPVEAGVTVEQVLSVQISNAHLENLREPIVQSFHRKNSVSPKPGGCNIRWEKCGYFDIPNEKWKYDGCTINVSAIDGSATCYCNHATNFAVLVQSQHVQSSFALSVIGTIGCIFSVIGLLLLLIIYLSFRPLRNKKLNHIHMNLSASLLLGYITFLSGVERPRSYASCIIVGVIIQFAFLSAWGWMIVEFVAMYKKLIRVFSDIDGNFLFKSGAVVYSLSLLTTAITVLVAYIIGDSVGIQEWSLSPMNDPLCWKSHYVSDRLCWLHSYSLYFGFLTPVAVMFLINFFGYFMIMRVITRPSPDLGQSNQRTPELKDHAFRIFTVSVLLGVTWAFAVPLAITDDPTINEAFSWLFSLSNAFQGLFIFLLYCVKREEVRKLWIGVVLKLVRRGDAKENGKENSATINSIDIPVPSHYQETKFTTLPRESKIGTLDMRTTNFA